MAGAYLSVFKGRGMEFDEVRPYVPGDDVRAIDWNVTARTGEPHVKRFVEERELTVMLMVDVSASQDFGSGRRSKLEAAVELSALLAMSAVENGDKVGLLLFHGGADLYIPPRKGGKHSLRIVREVLARGQGLAAGPIERGMLVAIPRAVRTLWHKLRRVTAPVGTTAAGANPRRATSIAAALEFCRQVLPRRAVLFLISDFLDDDYLQVLRHANRKHDVVAALITDPRESRMPPAGLVTLEDAETGRTRLVDTHSQAFRTARRARERAPAAAARSAARDRDGSRRVRRERVDGRSAAQVLPRARAEASPMRRIAILTGLAVGLAACGGGAAEDSAPDVAAIAPTKDAIAKTTENGPVKATVTVWPGKPALGDAIYLRLSVESPAGISVDAPFQEAGDQKMGRFKVVGFTRSAARKPDGGQLQEQTYTLEPPTSGKQRVPPLRLEMVDARGGSASGAGSAQEILTEEVPLDVAPVADAAINAELKGARAASSIPRSAACRGSTSSARPRWSRSCSPAARCCSAR